MTSHSRPVHAISSGELKMLYLTTGIGAVFSCAFVNVTLSKLASPAIGMAAGTGVLFLLLSVPHRLLQVPEARPSVTRQIVAVLAGAILAGVITYAVNRWL